VTDASFEAAAFFTFVIASPVLAQTVPQYPAKPVRMIVTAAAGSPDITRAHRRPETDRLHWGSPSS
jgi:hypothetical protein